MNIFGPMVNSEKGRRFFCIMSFVLLFISISWGQKNTLKKIQMVEDLTIVQNALEEAHPGFYWHHSKLELDSVFQRCLRQIPEEATVIEFSAILNDLVDFIGCGHSAILPSEKMIKNLDKSGRFLPFTISLDEGIVKVDSSLTDVLFAGDQLRSIDGISISKIISELKKRIPSDKGIDSKKRRTIELVFSYLYSLYFGSKEVYAVEIQRSGMTKLVQVNSVKWKEGIGYKSVRSYVRSSSPLVFNMNNEFAYLKLQTFSPGVYQSIEASFEESLNRVFPLIVSANKKLILDLRDNNGGSLGYASTLYAHLTNQKFRYFSKNEIKANVANGQFSLNQYCEEKIEAMPFEGAQQMENDRLIIQRTDTTMQEENPHLGPLYIVTNGLTFSSAAMFTSYCKMNRPNTFVLGELPGGAASGCNGGGPVTLNLPHSKWRLYFNLVQLDLNIGASPLTIPMDLQLPAMGNGDIYSEKLILYFVLKGNKD